MIPFERICGFELQVGMIILCWVEIVGNTLASIIFGILAAHVHSHQNNYVYTYECKLENLFDVWLSVKISVGIGLGLSILGVITAIIMLAGTLQAKRLLLLPYLLMEIIFGLTILAYVLMVITFFKNYWVKFGAFMFGGVYFALAIYIFICIVSLYYIFKKSEAEMPTMPLLTRPSLSNTYQHVVLKNINKRVSIV